MKEPTRYGNLLDLLMSNIPGTSHKLIGRVADHKGILASVSLRVPVTAPSKRWVWKWEHADWNGISQTLSVMNWQAMRRLGVDDATLWFTEHVLALLGEHVPGTYKAATLKSHPWVTPEVVQAVKAKFSTCEGAGGINAAQVCSNVIMKARRNHVRRTKTKLETMQRGCKLWWKLSKEIQSKVSGTNETIPALVRAGTKEWAMTNKQKANLLLDTFTAKFVLPPLSVNEYSNLQLGPLLNEGMVKVVTKQMISDVLRILCWYILRPSVRKIWFFAGGRKITGVSGISLLIFGLGRFSCFLCLGSLPVPLFYDNYPNDR